MNECSRRTFLTWTGAAVLVQPRSVSAQIGPALRVACIATDPFAEAIYAQDAGFFQAAGLAVDLVLLPSSGAIAAAVAGGSADIGLANLISVANAHIQGVPFAIIAPSALYVASKPTTLLVVAEKSPLRSPKDLEGKTIGLIEVRGMTEAAVQAWLAKSGADTTSVHYVELPFPTMAPALTAGRIDAAFIGEPFLAAARATTREIGNPNAVIADTWYQNAWFANRDAVAKKPQLYHRFVLTIEKAGAWENAHQSETAAILQKYTRMSDDTIAKMIRTGFGTGKIDVTKIQPVLDMAAKTGVLKAPVVAGDLLMPDSEHRNARRRN